MNLKVILIGILTAFFVLFYNARWLLRHPLPYIWRAFLVGAGVSVAIAFAQKSIQIFLEAEREKGTAAGDGASKKAATREKIVDEEGAVEAEQESDDEKSKSTDPDQSPMSSDVEAEEDSEMPVDEINEESAEQLADVIKGSISEE